MFQGTVRPGPDGTVAAPFSNRACTAVDWRVEAFFESRNPNRYEEVGWHPVADGDRSTAFRVSDGTGSVLVRPESARLDFRDRSEDLVAEVEPNADPPAAVASALQDEAIPLNPTADEARRYYEGRIEAGDEVAVVGHATEDGGLVVDSPAAGSFVVTDRDPGALIYGPFVPTVELLGGVAVSLAVLLGAVLVVTPTIGAGAWVILSALFLGLSRTRYDPSTVSDRLGRWDRRQKRARR